MKSASALLAAVISGCLSAPTSVAAPDGAKATPLQPLSAKGTDMPNESDPKILAFFDLLVQSSPPTREAIENKLGRKFARPDGRAAPYVIASVHLEKTELLDIRLVEGEKAAISTLSADIGGACIRSETILARYGFDSVRSPTGHSSAELTYWRRDTEAGQVSFGFDQGAASCLKSIVFDAAP